MSRWYTLPGWPARVNGHSAATPVLVRPPGSATQYKDGVTGWPGTRGIPVKPEIPSPDPGDIAMMGVSRSSDAPNTNYPNLYWARWARHYYPGAGMSISIHSDNMMPVPATDPRSVAAPLAVPLNLRGAKQIRQPPSGLVQWPGVNG